MCDSYLNARKEVGILLSLQHDHIVPLLALCLDPLSLVLQLAPQGSLSDRLKEYLRAGDRLTIRVIRDVIIQVSELPVVSTGVVIVVVLSCDMSSYR